MTDPATRDRRLARLRARLAEQLALKEVEVTLPRAGRVYTILSPADHDRLLDEAETDPEQNLPYWAEVWPSGIALGVDRPLRIANDPAVDRDAALARVERGLRARARAELRQRARKTVARRSWRLALQG